MRNVQFWALLSCFSAASLPAQAALISGSLTGTVISGHAVSGSTLVNVAGANFTETFALNTLAHTQPTYVGTGISYTGLGGNFVGQAIDLTFVISSGNLSPITISGDGGSNVLVLEDDGTSQSIGLYPNGEVDNFSGVDISGPEGSLFSNIGLIETLHIGPGAMLDAPASFYFYKETAPITVNITKITLVSNVPEPPGWSVLAVCLAAMAFLLGKRRPTS